MSIMKIKRFIQFAKEQGLGFAIKYKLGLAREGIDFITIKGGNNMCMMPCLCEDCPFLYDDCDGNEEYWEREELREWEEAGKHDKEDA